MAISPRAYFDSLRGLGIEFYAGVPDSLLKDFCAYVEDHAPAQNHVIPANEGSAIGLAAGFHLATGKVPLVYLQNSGLGNVVNPVTSLMDPEVYGIPCVLMVGHRGRPGIKDEPQHKKMGKITHGLLEAMGVPVFDLPEETARAISVTGRAIELARDRNGPVALVVREGSFERYTSADVAEPFTLERNWVLRQVVEEISGEDICLSTTGHISREIYAHMKDLGSPIGQYFFNIGAMGHNSQVALGVSMFAGKRRVFCVDGDGALLMHMGGLCAAGLLAGENFYYMALNNGAHVSVGGQATLAGRLSFDEIARQSGFATALRVSGEDEWATGWRAFLDGTGPRFMEVKVQRAFAADLPRPTETPTELITAFKEFVCA